MFYNVSEVDIVASSCDSVKVRVFGEAGILDLIGVFVR